jgi:hypothetical protein
MSAGWLSPTRRAYGPQHALVTRWLGRVARAPIGDWLEAARALDGIEEREWDDGLLALRDTALRHALTHRLERAATDARDASWPVVRRLNRDLPRLAVLAPSMIAAAAGAAGALVLRGLLPAEAASTLYLPWADLVPLYEIDPA